MTTLNLNKETLRSLDHTESEKVDGAWGVLLTGICFPYSQLCNLDKTGPHPW